jgi:hypothetical protein
VIEKDREFMKEVPKEKGLNREEILRDREREVYRER